MNWLALAKTAWTAVKTFTVVNAPVICLVATGVGVVTTAVIAYKSGKKSQRIIDEAEKAKGEKLSTKEKFKFTWKQILAICISVILTCSTATAGYLIEASRLAEMTATCQILMANSKELNNQIEDIRALDPELVRKVQEHHLQELGERTLVSYDEANVYLTGYGNELFFDAFLGILFKSSTKEVLAGKARFEQRFRSSKKGVKVSDWLECQHIMKEGMVGESLCWPKLDSLVDDFDLPCVTVSHQVKYDEDIGGEFTDDYTEINIITYFPQCFSGEEYALQLDNSYRKGVDPEDIANFV